MIVTYTTADLALDLLQALGFVVVFFLVMLVGALLISKFLHGARGGR
jgi:hypothetical protein